MPRKPRFFIPGVAVHIVQRGHSRNPVFFDTGDYHTYLDYLHDAVARHGCQLHAYVLMTNHIHILLTPDSRAGVSLAMQSVNRLYVPYINCTYGTSGSLWEGRFKASLINQDEYLLTCMRYIELNPVRAGMVTMPEEYRWSSYGVNAWGDKDDNLTPHNLYLSLGKEAKSRRQAYRRLFNAHIDDRTIGEIRKACMTGTPLGNDRFREMVEMKLQCKVGQNHRGRPSKGI
jgi:putative transposase